MDNQQHVRQSGCVILIVYEHMLRSNNGPRSMQKNVESTNSYLQWPGALSMRHYDTTAT